MHSAHCRDVRCCREFEAPGFTFPQPLRTKRRDSEGLVLSPGEAAKSGLSCHTIEVSLQEGGSSWGNAASKGTRPWTPQTGGFLQGDVAARMAPACERSLAGGCPRLVSSFCSDVLPDRAGEKPVRTECSSILPELGSQVLPGCVTHSLGHRGLS